MITCATWKWTQSYRHAFLSEYANILERSVRRAYDGDIRFITITDDPEGIDGETFPLWDDCADIVNPHGAKEYPSCYRRLKLFDPETQRAMGIAVGDKIVSIDLDVIVIDDLNYLWDRSEPFVGWAVKNRFHDRVFNGSMWLFRAGEFADVWAGFDPEKTPKRALEAGFLGSDQAVMTMLVGTDQAGWTQEDGIYTRMECLRERRLPGDARIVSFHGNVKPWDAAEINNPAWVGEYWK